MDRQLLRSQLERHEELRLKPYLDTAVPPRLTIGYGRNLDDAGISREESDYMLANDIDKVERELDTIDEYVALDRIRQTVIANMSFNLGFNGLLQFKRMWAAIGRCDYEKAAKEMLDSKWKTQVGYRALELAEIMRTGEVVGG